MYFFQNISITLKLARALLMLAGNEIRRGTFRANLKSLAISKEIAEDMSWAELLEERAKKPPAGSDWYSMRASTLFPRWMITQTASPIIFFPSAAAGVKVSRL